MATEKQKAANQANAARSTGPKTAAGRKRASRNSLKHGIFSRDLVLPWEDPKAFNALLEGLCDDLKPEGITEALLVEQMAVAIWKQSRLTGQEAAIMRQQWRSELGSTTNRGLDTELLEDKALAFTLPLRLDRILAYQQLLSRDFYRAYNTLQARRREREKTIDGEAEASP